MQILPICMLAMALAAVGACKPRDYNSNAEEQSLNVKPLDSFVDENATPINVVANDLLKREVAKLKSSGSLPSDLVDYISGESFGIRSVEFFLKELSEGKQWGQCWYYTKVSSGGAKTNHLLTQNFVSGEGIKKVLTRRAESAERFEKRSLNELLLSEKPRFYDCLKGQQQCQMDDMWVTEAFVVLYLPSVVEAGKDRFFWFLNKPCPKSP